VRIQCERCSTTYDLDDARLPPGGAKVQCTRCGHVFRAAAPSRTGDATLVGLPAPPAPGPDRTVEAGRATAPAADASRTSVCAPGAAGGFPGAGARPADAPRASGGDAARAGAGGAPGAPRRRRWPWLLLAALVLAALALLLGGCSLFRSRVDPAAWTARDEALAALARDATPDLERAADGLAAASAADPDWVAPRADLALVLLLEADDLSEAARRPERRVQALEAEVAALEAAPLPGWQARRDELAARAAQARGEAEGLRDRARARTARARAVLEPLADADGPEVARARAMLAALAGDAPGAARLAPAGPPPDPWGAAAVATAVLRRPGPDPKGSAAEALPALQGAVAARPEALRARVVLARALAAAGRKDEAVAAVDGVLAANPGHERARVLKAEILAPPPVAVSAVPVPPVAPAPQRPGTLPRLPGAGKAKGKVPGKRPEPPVAATAAE
jgi:predicted Zn finger-like uncharacterized protein